MKFILKVHFLIFKVMCGEINCSNTQTLYESLDEFSQKIIDDVIYDPIDINSLYKNGKTALVFQYYLAGGNTIFKKFRFKVDFYF